MQTDRRNSPPPGSMPLWYTMCHWFLNSTIAAWFVVVLLTVSRMRPRYVHGPNGSVAVA